MISMFCSSLSSFWSPSFGKFSPIHILSLFTIYWLIQAIIAARYKKADWKYIHATHMGFAYIGILIAGAGVFIRHYVDPGNTKLGYIISFITLLIAYPILMRKLKKYII